jgi:hypothetical protein
VRGRRYYAASAPRGGLWAGAKPRIVSAGMVALAVGFSFGWRTGSSGASAPLAAQTIATQTIRAKSAASARSWQLASLDIALVRAIEDDAQHEPTGSIPDRTAVALHLSPSERVLSFEERWVAPVQLASFDDRWSAIGLPNRRPTEEIVLLERAPSRTDAPAHPPVRSVVARPAPAPAPVRLASLTPANISQQAVEAAPEAAPEADQHTAIYDIAAHTVYMPDGRRLEAHSGLGSLLDNPHYVSAKDRGPTPPNVYDLSERESLFHGVRALRLTPVGDGKMYGRDGLLAHTYMLGANGQSNGCVSFNDYSAFLHAYLNGEVTRLVVVDHLANPPPASRTASTWISEKLKTLFGHS